MSDRSGIESTIAPHPALTSSVSESAEISRVLGDYLLAWHSARPERMARALHPALIKRRIDHERESGPPYLRTLRFDEMIAATEAGLGLNLNVSLAEIDVRVLCVSGEIASAVIESPDWIDLVHLINDGRVWRVLDVLYRKRDAPLQAQL